MKLDDNFFLEAESVLREIEQECSIKILDIYESNEILQENKSDGHLIYFLAKSHWTHKYQVFLLSILALFHARLILLPKRNYHLVSLIR